MGSSLSGSRRLVVVDGEGGAAGAAAEVVRVRDGWAVDMEVGHPRARRDKRYRGRLTVSESPRPFRTRCDARPSRR